MFAKMKPARSAGSGVGPHIGSDGRPFQVDGGDAGGLETGRPDGLCADAGPARTQLRRPPTECCSPTGMRRWADWIAARMQTPGTVFVAVGAGHLAGKDSVLVQLAERGIDSTPGQLTALETCVSGAPALGRALP